MKRREGLSLLLVPILGAFGCSKPKPPTLTPRSVRVTGASRYRMELSVQLDVHNPNSFPLAMSQVIAKCEEPGGTLLGTASSALALTIPAKADQLLDVKLNVEIDSASVLPPFYFKARPREYRLRGTAKFADDQRMMVPFLLDSALTVDEQMRTGLVGGGIK